MPRGVSGSTVPIPLGTTLGDITIISGPHMLPHGPRKRAVYYFCQCRCGKTSLKYGSRLLQGKCLRCPSCSVTQQVKASQHFELECEFFGHVWDQMIETNGRVPEFLHTRKKVTVKTAYQVPE